MIEIKTTMPGKKALYGDCREILGEHGFQLGGGWDFHQGHFDMVLKAEDEDKMYLRMPFVVVDGMLDEDSAMIEFGTPFIINHIMNIGLDDEESPVLAAVGLDQFQTPDDPDAPIPNSQMWVDDAEEVVSRFSESGIFIAPYIT